MELEQSGLKTDYDEAIRVFWVKIKGKEVNRLALLKEMSSVKVIKKNDLLFIRQRFNMKNMKRDKHCFSCSKPSHIKHHIILLNHGGNNQTGNIVSLCNKCHNYIHPWLQDKPVFIPNETLKQVITRQRKYRKTNNY